MEATAKALLVSPGKQIRSTQFPAVYLMQTACTSADLTCAMTRSRVSSEKASSAPPPAAALRDAARMSALPRLLVMMITALRKLTVRPCSKTVKNCSHVAAAWAGSLRCAHVHI